MNTKMSQEPSEWSGTLWPAAGHNPKEVEWKDIIITFIRFHSGGKLRTQYIISVHPQKSPRAVRIGKCQRQKRPIAPPSCSTETKPPGRNCFEILFCPKKWQLFRAVLSTIWPSPSHDLQIILMPFMSIQQETFSMAVKAVENTPSQMPHPGSSARCFCFIHGLNTL